MLVELHGEEVIATGRTRREDRIQTNDMYSPVTNGGRGLVCRNDAYQGVAQAFRPAPQMT